VIQIVKFADLGIYNACRRLYLQSLLCFLAHPKIPLKCQDYTFSVPAPGDKELAKARGSE